MKFGEFLVQKEYVSEDDLDKALQIQAEQDNHLKIGEVLVAIYAFDHKSLKKALREYGIA